MNYSLPIPFSCGQDQEVQIEYGQAYIITYWVISGDC